VRIKDEDPTKRRGRMMDFVAKETKMGNVVAFMEEQILMLVSFTAVGAFY
jgi:hypothetical protein